MNYITKKTWRLYYTRQDTHVRFIHLKQQKKKEKKESTTLEPSFQQAPDYRMVKNKYVFATTYLHNSFQ